MPGTPPDPGAPYQGDAAVASQAAHPPGPRSYSHSAARQAPPRRLTYWVPVAVSALVQIVPALVALRPGVGGRFPAAWAVHPPEVWLGLSLAVAGPVALLFARRYPGPVVAVTAAAAAADLLFGAVTGPPYVALAFATIGAIVRGARIWAWASVGACWALTLLLVGIIGHGGWSAFRIVGMTLGILVVLGIGELLRARREAAAEDARLAQERRQSEVHAERTRIARELHDVLAHSLSQINVQAGVGLHLLERQPDKAAESLANIKETSKSALDEVRAVLGVLRAEGKDAGAPLVPEPELSRLPALVAAAAGSGIRAELDDRLDHAMVPKPLHLALYRIVQESLTNVQRHADGARLVRVVLRQQGDEALLEVTDDGRASGPAGETGGRGVLGMRERAELLGGRLSAGPAEGGGFRVVARIPLGRSGRSESPAGAA